jgi:hypothetical protein
VEKEMEEPPSADAAAAEKAVSVPEAVPLPEVDAPTVVMSEAPKAPGEAPEAAASEPQAEAASEGASGAPLEEAAEELEAEVQAERVVTETGEIAAGASAEAGGVVLTATLTVSVTEGFVVSPSAPPPTLRLGAERTAATGEPTVVVVASTRALSPTPAASLTIPTTPTPPPTATVDQPLPTSMPVEPTPIPVEAAAEATAAPTLLPQPTSAPTAVAEALEPAGQVEESWYQELAGKRQRMDIDPLRVLEVGLGLMLVLLAAATILLMVQRRRA